MHKEPFENLPDVLDTGQLAKALQPDGLDIDMKCENGSCIIL